MKIYMLCPVRNCDPETKAQLDAYVEKLEVQGHVVHYPPRDVDQSDPVGTDICFAHRTAMVQCDAVHIWWDPDSTGSKFDLGMLYMMKAFNFNTNIVLVNSVEATPHKSLSNVVRWMADE